MVTARLYASVVSLSCLLIGCGSAPSPVVPEPPPSLATPSAPTPLPSLAKTANPLVDELTFEDAAKVCADIDAIAVPESVEASGMCQNVATFDVMTNFSKSRKSRVTKAKVRASCRKSFGKCMKQHPTNAAARVSSCSLRPLDQCHARVDDLIECVRAKANGFARRAARGIDECDAVSEAVATGRGPTIALPEGCAELLQTCPGLQ